MLDQYQTVFERGDSEVVVKKSRFIGEIAYVETIEEAEEYIAGVRKKYYDARHHCFAFLVGDPGTPDEIVRASDDGEPQGTAGKPMLEVLKGAKIHQAVLVVTRYFGGTLLGTGGLVRAYTEAAQEAVRNAVFAKRRRGTLMVATVDYTAYGRLQYLFAKEEVPIADSTFEEVVTMKVVCPGGRDDEIRRLIIEATDGKAVLGDSEAIEYSDIDGEIVIS